MKIMKRRAKNRNSETLETLPKKKALLVGIQYENDEDDGKEGVNVLHVPHHDVNEMRELLIDCYEYAPGDIVVLIDRDDPGQIQPTRANIVPIGSGFSTYLSDLFHSFERFKSWLKTPVRVTIFSFTTLVIQRRFGATGRMEQMNVHFLSVGANVICLAACNAGQVSWKDQEGSSMTKVLTNALRVDPHPGLVDLLTQVSHELHTMYLRLQSDRQAYKKQVKDVNRRRLARGLSPYRMTALPDLDNFQDPQMSSRRPLDRDAKWNP